MDKYILPDSFLDRIRNRNKCSVNDSNHLKDLCDSFPLICNHLAWKVGSGQNVRVGSDSIIGCGASIFLLEEMIAHLQ